MYIVWQPNSLLAGPAAHIFISNYYFLMMTLGSLWGGEPTALIVWISMLMFYSWTLSLFNSRSRLLWVSPVKRGHLSIRATSIADLSQSIRQGERGVVVLWRVNKSCVTQSNPTHTFRRWGYIRNGARTVDERDDNNNLVAGTKRHLLGRWKSIGCHRHRRSGLRSISWRVPILGSKSEFDILISRGLQAKIQLIDHATRLNDASILFVAVEGIDSLWRVHIRESNWIHVYLKKKAELKRDGRFWYVWNAVPFLGLCDPVLVGSDDSGWWIWAIQFSKVHGAISFF